MAKILSSAVVILTVMWLIRDLYAVENNQRSNSEDFYFYFDDSSTLSNKSISLADHLSRKHINSPERSKEIKANRNKSYENGSKLSSDKQSSSESIVAWDVKRFLQYMLTFLNFLHESKNNGVHERAPINYEKGFEFKSSNPEINRLINASRKYEDADKDNSNDSEFETSGEGNDSEYYDDEDMNTQNKNTPLMIVKGRTNMTSNLLQNQSKIEQYHYSDSLIKERNPANHKNETSQQILNSQNITNGKQESPRFEFIDEYINSPERNVPATESGISTNDQTIKSYGSKREMSTTLNPINRSASERKTLEKEGGKIRNIDTSNSEKVKMKINLPFYEGTSDSDLFGGEVVKFNSTTQISVSDESSTIKNRNSTQAPTVKNLTQSSFTSNYRFDLSSQAPKENIEITTIKIAPFHEYSNPQSHFENSPKQFYLYKESKSQKYPNKNTNRENSNNYKLKNIHNTNPRPVVQFRTNIRDSSQIDNDNNRQIFGVPQATDRKRMRQQAEIPHVHTPPENIPFITYIYQGKNTPSLNSSNISSFDVYESEVPSELKPVSPIIFNYTTLNLSKVGKENFGFPKQIQFSQKENMHIFKEKQDLNKFNDTKTVIPQTQFIHLSHQDQSHRLKTLIPLNQFNNTKIISMQNKFNNTNELLSPDAYNSKREMTLQNKVKYSEAILLEKEINSTELLPQTDAKETEIVSAISENKTDVSSTQQSINIFQYPIQAGAQNWTLNNNSEELQTNKSSDTDYESSDGSDSDQSAEDDEYDEYTEELFDILDYMEEVISNSTIQLPQNSSLSNSNYSINSPIALKNETGTEGFIEPQETFNSILEYIYKYSKNPLFARMREQKNVTM